MISSAQSIENLTLNLTQEIHVRASLDATFAALLEEIGPHNETHDGKPLPMKIETRPDGRWYRDLGEDNGHFWGLVQAIKRPNHRPVVHVLSGGLQFAVSTDRGRRGNADCVPAHGPWIHRG